MDPYRIDFREIMWESPVAGVRHKVRRMGSRRLRLVEYSPEMEPHWCAKGHAGMILEGEFAIEFATGEQIFKRGDGVFIPDGEGHSHRARALTDVVRAIFVEDVAPDSPVDT